MFRLVLAVFALVACAHAYSDKAFKSTLWIIPGSNSQINGIQKGDFYYDHSSNTASQRMWRFDQTFKDGSSVSEVVKTVNVPVAGTSSTQAQVLRYLNCASSCETENFDVVPELKLYRESSDAVGSLETVGTGNIQCQRYTKQSVTDPKAIKIIWLQTSGSNTRVCTAQTVGGETYDFTAAQDWADVNRNTEIAAFPPAGANCPNPTCGAFLDIMLVMDQSGSINDNEENILKNFATAIIDSYTFNSQTGVMMGIVLFNSGSRLLQPLSAVAQNVKDRMNGDRFDGGATCNGRGIATADSHLQSNHRNGAGIVVIVMTDGQDTSCSTSFSVNAARALENNHPGAVIIAVGVDGANQNALNQMATDISGVQTAFYTPSFSGLSSILSSLLVVTCTSVTGGNCGSDCHGFCSCGSVCKCPSSCADINCKSNTCTDTNAASNDGCVAVDLVFNQQGPTIYDVCKTNGQCDPNTGLWTSDPVNCDDNNACTTDECVVARGGCTYVNFADSCGSNFTDADCIVKGVCFETCNSETVTVNGIDYQCNGGVPGCNFTFAVGNGDCACKTERFDQNNPCPTTNCYDTVCVNSPFPPGCETGTTGGIDYSACTHAPAWCQNTSKTFCDTGTVCFTSQCDTSDGTSCTPLVALDCDDGQACTEDSCDPVNGCQHRTLTDAECDDGNPCTIDTVDCTSPTGCKHENKTCESSDYCRVGVCDASSGQCNYLPRDCAAVIGEIRFCVEIVCVSNVSAAPFLDVYMIYTDPTADENTTVPLVPRAGLQPWIKNITGRDNDRIFSNPLQLTIFSEVGVDGAGELQDLKTAFDTPGSYLNTYLATFQLEVNYTILTIPTVNLTNLEYGCVENLINGGVRDECNVCGGDGSTCDSQTGIDTATAAGIGAGVLAAIILAVIAAFAIMGYGGKKGFDYLRGQQAGMTGVQDNPLYQDQGGATENPLFEEAMDDK